ncbi:MAG: SH3 domain-containing protein [Candidatus Rokubacteria bacterium]|nr:SH3 domain-containing protein [Candidatus Rokubacteria bacterium]
MRTRVIVVTATVCAIAGLAAAQGAARWVDRTKADVRAGRGSFYEVVDTVTKGEKLQIERAEDRWLHVVTPRARRGWIFESALAAAPVTPGSSSFLKMVPGDASTSATAASTGAKGVYAQTFARDRGYDYSVVTWVEANQPAAADVERFVREGGLALAGSAR